MLCGLTSQRVLYCGVTIEHNRDHSERHASKGVLLTLTLHTITPAVVRRASEQRPELGAT